MLAYLILVVVLEGMVNGSNNTTNTNQNFIIQRTSKQNPTTAFPFCIIVERVVNTQYYKGMDSIGILTAYQRKQHRLWSEKAIPTLIESGVTDTPPPHCNNQTTGQWYIFQEKFVNYKKSNQNINNVLPRPRKIAEDQKTEIEDRSFDGDDALEKSTVAPHHHSHHISPFSLGAFVVYAVLGSIPVAGLASFFVLYKRYKRTEREDALRLEQCKFAEAQKTDERSDVLKVIAQQVGYSNGIIVIEGAKRPIDGGKPGEIVSTTESTGESEL